MTARTDSLDRRVGVALAALRADLSSSSPHSRPPRLDRLTGDASNRIYVRAHAADLAAHIGSETVMAMVLPANAGASEEIGSGATGPRARLPFLEMAEWLAGRGVPVPRIHRYDEATQVVLLEDLGDLTLERALDPTNRLRLYDEAVDLLVTFQQHTAEPEAALVASGRRFDRELLAWELDHYVEWRLLADLGLAPGRWQSALTRAFEPLLDALGALPVRLVHRDFQSRNIMLSPDGQMTLIDFQDALMGPFVYDAVALLRDSYVTLEPSELDHLLKRYASRAREAELIDAEPAAIERAFFLQTVQRKLKDTGRFVFIDRVKGNPAFLPYRSRSMRYVRHALEQLDELAALRQLICELDSD